MKKTAWLVSLEGIDMAGKTTQAQLLCNALRREGYSVASFKFPDGDTFVGKLLLDALAGKISIPFYALFVLFTVNRLERKESIETAKASNAFVVFDRYSESEYAYGGAKGLPRDWLLELESQVPPADLVVVLDIDPYEAFQRARSLSQFDLFEKDLDFLMIVRRNYLDLAGCPPRDGQRWLVIDGTQTPDAIHKAILISALGINSRLPSH